jgi:hypothetical protein
MTGEEIIVCNIRVHRYSNGSLRTLRLINSTGASPCQRLRFGPAAAPDALPGSWIVKKRLGLHVLTFGKAAR